MRQVAGSLRLDLAQYREMAAFAQFGSGDLDKATQQQLNRGARLVEILKQPQYRPLPVEQQVAVIYAGTNGFIDAVDIAHVPAYQDELFTYMATRQSALLETIKDKKTLDDAVKAQLNAALKEFGEEFTASRMATA